MALSASERSERYRLSHLTERRAYARDWYRRRRAWLDSLKAKPCADCGGEFPAYCMDWHHEGDKTEYGDGSAFKWNWSRRRILAEIAKCVLLCAICHRRRHHA